MSDNLLLEARGLVKSFDGVQAVRDVSFAVRPGEIVALIGPNGAGKTTCFNILNGQLAPDRGAVFIAGQEVTAASPQIIARLGVGRTFQIAATFASMSVRENVQVGLTRHRGRSWRPFGFAGHLFRSEADALLAQVGIADQADRAAGHLAYGDLKRVELAMALTNEPRLLLMDEPTSGMAPAERGALMRLTARIAEERRIGILFTEHDMDIVFGEAQRVLVLDRGQLIAGGTPEAIRADPLVQAVYLGGAATLPAA